MGRCFDSICNAIKATGTDCDVIDIRALVDDTLSCDQNKRMILKDLGLTKRAGDDYYEAMYAEEYGKDAKMKCKDPVKVKAHKRSCPSRRYK